MYSITLISTMHKKHGKCNADELCNILERIAPDVIFLEALEDSYSKYEEFTFFHFNVDHRGLEINAIQKYSQISQSKYVPVLDKGLSDSFEKGLNLFGQNFEYCQLNDNFNLQAKKEGFDFLNSTEGMKLREEMRLFGDQILNDNKLNERFYQDLNKYENSMLDNIYSYSRDNKFEKAVFMCGSAHRQSIINKLETYKSKESLAINWHIYGNQKI